MFAAIYRWKVKAGFEEQFERGWTLGTERIAEELGGWGSRLHRAADGTYFAYAEWPDEATWQRAVAAGMPHSDDEARRLYRGSFEPSSFEVVFAGPVVADRLGLGAADTQVR